MQLQQLKKMYDTCRLSKENHALLLQQREDLHDQIVRLKEEAEAALYKQKDPPRGLDSLIELKERLKAVDHQIDEIGEHHDEELTELREQLVTAIHHSFPESASAYQQLSQRLQTHRGEEKGCIALCEHLRSFYAALDEGAAAKQSRGFFGFLFGRNAKVILARAIRKAAIEAERVNKQIDDERIQHFLATFLEEANRSWNSNLYRERFYELHQEFSQLMEKLEERKTRCRRNAIKTEQEIEIWIERYCRI